MTTEATLAAGLQDEMQEITSVFDSVNDVTLNDWSILDGERSSAPFCIIRTSDEFDSRMGASVDNTIYQIPAGIWVQWQDWDTALAAFLTARDAVLSHFNAATNARSLGGLNGVSINRIYTMTPVTPDYLRYVDPELDREALPEYLFQWLGFEVETF